MEETLGPVIHRPHHLTFLQKAAAISRLLWLLCLSTAAAQTAAPVTDTPEKIAQGYLYVEPYQTRFEALIDATRLHQWVHPNQDVPTILDAADQKVLTDAASKQTLDWCQLTAGTHSLTPAFLGASVIKGKPAATLPFEPGSDIPIGDAMIGFIWEFPTPPAPDTLTLQWRGFIADIQTLPIRVFFGSKSEVLEVSTTLSKTTWKALGRLPMPKPLASVPTISSPAPYPIPLASILWGLGGLLFYSYIRIREHHLPGGSIPFLAVWIFGAVLSWPLLNIDISGSADIPPITDKQEAEKIITPLLRNVYRAFDHRVESEIYDVLTLSVHGELLRKLYLETIQALTLDGREGTRVTITEFSADILSVQPDPDSPGFITDCQWTALGTVGHWGHAHTRVNRYTAKVTLSPIASAWKITQLDVSEARRL